LHIYTAIYFIYGYAYIPIVKMYSRNGLQNCFMKVFRRITNSKTNLIRILIRSRD